MSSQKTPFKIDQRQRQTMARHLLKCRQCSGWLKKPVPKDGWLRGMCNYGKGQIVKVVVV